MKRTIKAAGVLPYSKDAQGHVWFLLGREKPNSKWGVDSGSWSEFGGSLNNGETPEQGAAREFYEETMGSIFSEEWMRHELEHGRFLCALDSKTPSGKGYRSYVKYIPFVDYPSKFARYKTLSKTQPHLLALLVPECFENGRMIPSCTEKTSMWWFSAEQMKQAVDLYKTSRHTLTRGIPPNMGTGTGKESAYHEPGRVPHIRRGFAMDFDHLLSTSWAQAGFCDDVAHFSLVTPPTPAVGRILTTPRARIRKKRPPIVAVNVEGYSFNKKKRRRPKRQSYKPSPPVF